MIIDAHAHYTTAPPELQAYRGRQITNLARPAPPRLNIRSMHVRGGLEPFEEAVRRVYWDMAIYDKESMEVLIKRVGVDNVFFATEMFGATNAVDPQTGRNFEETVPLLASIEWLTEEDRYKITEGNVRKVYSRMAA
jgi:4-oxalmesaconate hydratase